jgi:secondary thiamine-phosphate synthase enzyme
MRDRGTWHIAPAASMMPACLSQANAAGHHAGELAVRTAPRAMTDITREVQAWVGQTGVTTGLLTLFIRHTSASLVIQENADPDVLADLTDALDRLAPEHAPYRHGMEGPDDMPAHIKSALTATSVSIPVMGARAALGTWQAIYIAEHRARGHERRVALHLSGA